MFGYDWFSSTIQMTCVIVAGVLVMPQGGPVGEGDVAPAGAEDVVLTQAARALNPARVSQGSRRLVLVRPPRSLGSKSTGAR